MKRSSTFKLGRAALAACLYAAAALSAQAGAPLETDRRTGDATARAVSGRTLMTPEELALLKEQVRRASTPPNAGSTSRRTR